MEHINEKVADLIDSIDSGDNLEAENILNDILQDKIDAILGVAKQEVAASMFNTEECADCEEQNEEVKVGDTEDGYHSPGAYDRHTNEALKGNQHKIDANKNGKIDAQDFKMLRKKKVKEAYADPYAAKKAAEMKKKKEEEMAAAKKEYDASQEAQGKINTKKFMKMEEVEIDEASYSAKMARAGKDIGKSGKMFKKISAKAARKYGKERGAKIAGAVLAKFRKKGK